LGILLDRIHIAYGIILTGPNFEGGIPIIKGGQVGKDRLSIDELSRTDPRIDEQYPRSRLRTGDLLVSIRGSFGDVMMIQEKLNGANMTQDSARIRSRSGVSKQWLYWTLTFETLQRQFHQFATGATIKGINIGTLRRVRLPLPPREVANAIADYFDRVTGKLQVPGIAEPSGSTLNSRPENPV
jgi:type I restriction enzyme, S subunit